jgi:hypothetical protein
LKSLHNQAREVTSHVYLCYGYTFFSLSTIFRLNLELLRLFDIFVLFFI